MSMVFNEQTAQAADRRLISLLHRIICKLRSLQALLTVLQAGTNHRQFRDTRADTRRQIMGPPTDLFRLGQRQISTLIFGITWLNFPMLQTVTRLAMVKNPIQMQILSTTTQEMPRLTTLDRLIRLRIHSHFSMYSFVRNFWEKTWTQLPKQRLVI
jgi:hypothetical protein